MKQLKTIEYKGKVFTTSRYTELTDNEFQLIKSEYFLKPNFDDVVKQLQTIKNGGTKNNLITNYYFKDIMCKTQLYSCKWTVEDVFNNKELLGYFVNKTLDNKKVFPDTHTMAQKVDTAIRLGGIGVAKKPTNFPIKTIDYILNKYNINNNYYDFSCGWGARLTSALKQDVNYFGTDPNYLLTEQLQNLSNDFHKYTNTKSLVDIRTIGSENLQIDWINKIGLAFSSPPYFNLEDYKIGKQSYKDGTSYKDWLRYYLYPTIKNVYSYLIPNGYFLININNFDKYDLIGDTTICAKKAGFNFITNETLVNNKRCKPSGGFNNNDEIILVFRKAQ